VCCGVLKVIIYYFLYHNFIIYYFLSLERTWTFYFWECEELASNYCWKSECRHTAGRGTYVSWHHRGPIKGCPETLTSQHYDIKGYKRAPNWSPIMPRDVRLSDIRGIFFVSQAETLHMVFFASSSHGKGFEPCEVWDQQHVYCLGLLVSFRLREWHPRVNRSPEIKRTPLRFLGYAFWRKVSLSPRKKSATFLGIWGVNSTDIFYPRWTANNKIRGKYLGRIFELISKKNIFNNISQEVFCRKMMRVVLYH